MPAKEPRITCPECGREIRLTESLAAPMVAALRVQYEKKLEQQNAAIGEREAAVKRHTEELARRTKAIEAEVANQVQARIDAERGAIATAEAKKARELLQEEMYEQQRMMDHQNERVGALEARLRTAQAAEVELLRKERELDDQKREVALKIEHGIQEGLDEVRRRAGAEAEQRAELELRDREHRIAELTARIGELKRKADQGSEQGQGEVLELLLEQKLRARFPLDVIEPVAKGESGADILQHVRDERGQSCGAILWESKRTGKWQDRWLAKLRKDQRAAGADMAVIVSRALPKTVVHFEQVAGIWVSSIACSLPIAGALREALIQLAFARQAGAGQETKLREVYAYLTGRRFRQRVETIVEKFTDMRGDLDKERKVMTRLWAKREEQIRLVLESTAGLYGDLEGIAGQSLEEIEAPAPATLLTEGGS